MKEFGARRPREARSANVGAVLRFLLAHGPTSRVGLANGIGLTQGPVTRIASLLIERGLVTEGRPLQPASARGRPRVPIEINSEAWQMLSVHVGYTQVAVWRVDFKGRVLEEQAVEHSGGPEEVVRAITELCEEFEMHDTTRLLGVGVVVGGWVDSRAGIVRRHPAMGWNDVPLVAMLEAALRRRVVLESAARAHALADMLYGTAAGEPDFIHFFIGNVIEMAMVVDGQVLSAPSGYGGDLSHWIIAGDDGQALRADNAISGLVAREAARTDGLIPPTGSYEDLVSLALSKDTGSERAKQLIAGLARSAAHLVAGVSKTLPTPMVIVSSGVVAIPEAIDSLTQEFERLMSGYPLPELMVSRQYRHQLAAGGAAVVMEHALTHDWLTCDEPPSDPSFI